ncbi:MAG: carbohydrate ABC transporter permease [Candidatus Caldatribacteriaceae bacterium]
MRFFFSLSRRREETWLPWILVTPVIAFLLIITIYPFIYGVYLSLSDFTLLGVSFRGLENFVNLFRDDRFLNSLKVTLVFVFSAVLLEFLVGLGIATLLNCPFRGKRVVAPLVYIPMIMAPIAVALMWRMLYSPEYGPINFFLLSSKLINRQIAWLSESGFALLSLIIVDTWQWSPFMFLILYAGLQSIPSELSEVAQIDGASGWEIFKHITLPLLFPFIVLAFLFRLMDAFKVFDSISVLTKGGPGTSTEVVSWLSYLTGFTYFRLGYAAAMALVLYLLVMVISQVLLRFVSLEV